MADKGSDSVEVKITTKDEKKINRFRNAALCGDVLSIEVDGESMLAKVVELKYDYEDGTLTENVTILLRCYRKRS